LFVNHIIPPTSRQQLARKPKLWPVSAAKNYLANDRRQPAASFRHSIVTWLSRN
jgi:hypothetical protein